jgi:hypothetical protein
MTVRSVGTVRWGMVGTETSGTVFSETIVTEGVSWTTLEISDFKVGASQIGSLTSKERITYCEQVSY